MKIGVYSDLHLEYHTDGGAALIRRLPNVDILVIAGDLSSSDKLLGAFDLICPKFKNVVYVLGNHELWGSSFSEARATLEKASSRYANLHVLDNKRVNIKGVNFLGATMFFANDPFNQLYEKHFVEFSLIKNYGNEVYAENERAVRFMQNEMQPGDFVITHHVPHRRSIHPMFERDDFNRFFMCDMEGMMVDKKPAVWVHGHTHFSFDYSIEGTRIICNPYGCSPVVNGGFDVNKIIVV